MVSWFALSSDSTLVIVQQTLVILKAFGVLAGTLAVVFTVLAGLHMALGLRSLKARPSFRQLGQAKPRVCRAASDGFHDGLLDAGLDERFAH